MLFSFNESENLQSNIDSTLKKIDATPFIITMSNQLKAALQLHSDWFVPRALEEDIASYKSRITKALQRNESTDSIFEAHLAFAQFFKALSLFSKIPGTGIEIIDFYLHPTHEEITTDIANKVIYNTPVEMAERMISYRLDKLEVLDKKIATWEKSLENWETRVSDSENRYQNVSKGNNYLGLAFAFNDLISKKTTEASSIKTSIFLLGLSALILPVINVVFGPILKQQEAPILQIISSMSFSIAAEVIIIYYFRILYHRWSDIKKQITQLELRHALCAFTHDYAEKSKDLDKTTLAKFENLVFSEISQDNSSPPNIYDAADSIAKLLAAWKSHEK